MRSSVCDEPCGSGLVWRGGLPPLGHKATLKPVTAILSQQRVVWFTTASQPNGVMRHSDKPPRHTSPLPHGLPLLGITSALHLAFGGLLGGGQGLLHRHLPGERRRHQLADRCANGLELGNGHVLDTDVGHGLG